ncbi:hypothetical protein [Kaarinaea lacus]
MLVLDAETLAKHYVNGSMSKEQFALLSSSLALVEQDIRSRSFLMQCMTLFQCPKELRNYTLKWRIKSALRFIKYACFAVLAISIIALWRVDSGDLKELFESGFDVVQFTELLVAGAPEPLPDDIRSAMQYLSNAAVWERLHVRKIRSQWSELDDQEKSVIRKSHWFQEFSLLVAVKNIEQEKRIVNGDIGAVRYLRELRALVTALA